MPTFGPIFARRAGEPLGRAKVELGAGRVHEALAALDPKRLALALRGGLDDVGRAAGASRATVEAQVTWDEVDRALAAVGESRAAAAAVWGDLPPLTGGLLEGVAEVTTVAENDDIGFYLDRLGHKMARDRSLAGPVDQLGADIELWQSLLRRIGETLDEHPRLLAARRMRALRRAALVLAAFVVVVPTAVILVVGWRARVAARERVDGALSAADPCLAESIAAGDLAVAGAAAEARAESRLAACKTVRESAARIVRCEALIGSVARGEPPGEDVGAVAGDARALVERVTRRGLLSGDLESAPAWPCEDQGAAPVLWRAFVEAAGKNLAIWQDPPSIHPVVLEQLVTHGLPPVARGALLGRAEAVSGHGVRQGDAQSLVRGAELCALARTLKIETATNCRGLDVVRAKGAGRGR